MHNPLCVFTNKAVIFFFVFFLFRPKKSVLHRTVMWIRLSFEMALLCTWMHFCTAFLYMLVDILYAPHFAPFDADSLCIALAGTAAPVDVWAWETSSLVVAKSHMNPNVDHIWTWLKSDLKRSDVCAHTSVKTSNLSYIKAQMMRFEALQLLKMYMFSCDYWAGLFEVRSWHCICKSWLSLLISTLQEARLVN